MLASLVCFYFLSSKMKMLIDRYFVEYKTISYKQHYFIITAVDPQHEAGKEILAAFRGFLRCFPDTKETGMIYGIGTWNKGDAYQHPSYTKAGCDRQGMENISFYESDSLCCLPLLRGGIYQAHLMPDLLAVMNTKQIHHDWNADYCYYVVHTGGGKGTADEVVNVTEQLMNYKSAFIIGTDLPLMLELQ